MKSVTTLALVLLLALGASAQNLLKNPGFEDPSGWSNHWTVRDAQGGNLTYHYHLTHMGGGHGDARPRSGSSAVEIYSSDRRTYLVQPVDLDPGRYRLSAYARVNDAPDGVPMELAIGDKKAVVPVFSARYKMIWADFEIESADTYEVSIHSPFYGVAIDDLSLVRINDQIADNLPIVHIDLYPSSRDRSENIQYCLKDSLQWVDFAVTCIAPHRIKYPIMRVMVTDPVRLSGLNEQVIHGYRMRSEDEVKLQAATSEVEGREYSGYSFPLPRFVLGNHAPLTFGGCWVSNVPSKGGKVMMDIVDGDGDDEVVLAREVITLIPVAPPVVQKTPKRFYTLGYAVQDWRQTLDERLKAIPAQFAMMGMNVWSDYGLSREEPTDDLSAEEMVLVEAYERYGLKQFWPNFSSMTEVTAGAVYTDISEAVGDRDMYQVGEDGTVSKRHYNFNYCANRGRAWMESSIAAWPRTLDRAAELKLPFRYSGMVNDGLEAMHYSYDKTTLAAFAGWKGVEASEVTMDKLRSDWKKDWHLFNMDLYARVVGIWSEEIKKVDPQVKTVNTASDYGPGGFDTLNPREHMKWAASVDYNMPQWYASHYYGIAYYDSVRKGDTDGVFGRHQGGSDLIPLLNLSMGGGLADPAEFRFKILDFLSSSSSVRGVGYYVMKNGFSDAKFMVGLSDVHTLLAEIEDYYADGRRDDRLVRLVAEEGTDYLIPGMDAEGQQVMVRPESSTSVRVHRLGREGRIALITVITHSSHGFGSVVKMSIDTNRLPNGGKGLSIIDRLTGVKRPLPDSLTVDTSRSKNVAVFEIVE